LLNNLNDHPLVTTDFYLHAKLQNINENIDNFIAKTLLICQFTLILTKNGSKKACFSEIICIFAFESFL